MSEIKALEELHEQARTAKQFMFYPVVLDGLRAIEAEIAERFIELPEDADGLPIRVGDLIEFGSKGERLEVTHIGLTKHGDPTIAYRRPNGTLDCSCIGRDCRHVRPRTLEDVLQDYMVDCEKSKLGNSDLIAKYADEIRELMREG